MSPTEFITLSCSNRARLGDKLNIVVPYWLVICKS